jgi:hypothetical protein
VQFDLNALIEDCLNIFRAKAEQQNIELISFTQPQVPRVISGDPTRLRQALLSLLACPEKPMKGEILLVRPRPARRHPACAAAVQDSGEPLAPAPNALLQAELHSHFLSSNRSAATWAGHRQAADRPDAGRVRHQDSTSMGNTLWLTCRWTLTPGTTALRPRRPLRDARCWWWTTTTPAARCWCSNAAPGA